MFPPPAWMGKVILALMVLMALVRLWQMVGAFQLFGR